MILILRAMIAYYIYAEFCEKIDICLQGLSCCFNTILLKVFTDIFKVVGCSSSVLFHKYFRVRSRRF